MYTYKNSLGIVFKYWYHKNKNPYHYTIITTFILNLTNKELTKFIGKVWGGLSVWKGIPTIGEKFIHIMTHVIKGRRTGHFVMVSLWYMHPY